MKYYFGKILTILLFLVWHCKTQGQTQTSQYMYNNDAYSTFWTEINKLESQGLPKSALEKVDSLYIRAKADTNPSQVIKTLIHAMKYRMQIDEKEDGIPSVINRLRLETDRSVFPIQPILQSMLGEMITVYVNNNLWRFSQRTTTVQFDENDIQTWSIDKLLDEAASQYLQSVKDDRTALVQISNFDAISEPGFNDQALRPTLFDFLLHRAIDHFVNERSRLTEPANVFTINSPTFFSDASEFAKLTFTSPDSTSKFYHALQLLQTGIKRHLKDERTDALVDIDLKRLGFVKENAVLDNKDSLYKAVLIRLKDQYKSQESYSEICYLLASHSYALGQSYQSAGDTTTRWNWREALDLCEDGIRMFPRSYGASYCRSLKTSIIQKELNIQTELVNLPDKPFLASVEFRNVTKVYLKVLRINDKVRKDISARYQPDQVIPLLNKIPEIQAWDLVLPDPGDYRQHRTEIRVEKLPLGQYCIMVSDNPQFSNKIGAAGFVYTHVSNIAYFNRHDDSNLSEFVMVHRNTGEPLEKVTAEIFVEDYNASTRKYESKKVGNAVSDKNGFLYPRLANNRVYKIRFSQGPDTLFLDDGFSHYMYQGRTQKSIRTHFFMDRAIYRPGQTLYFKGITLEQDEQRIPHIVPGKEVEVTLYDVNYQPVSTQKFTTNEYGTFNGTFVAPTTGLLGQMHLGANTGGEVYFSVEEYKRPKFAVSFLPIQGSYRFGDTIQVSGKAQAFAGNNIDGAKVSYRVVRTVVYPYMPWWYWRGGIIPGRQGSMEITNGITETDQNGQFTIRFPALEDKQAENTWKPEFRFEVIADVSDINGETRTGNTSIRVGAVALDINIEVPEKINKKQFKSFTISSKNLNGDFESAKGTITIHALTSPKRFFNSRYWQKPDMYLLEKADYVRDFPLFSYQDEDQIQNWKKKEKVFQGNFDTQTGKEVKLDDIRKWEPAVYLLTLKTTDKYGTPVEIQKSFTLYDLKDKIIPANQVIFTVFEQKQLEPGDTCKVSIGTADEKLKVLFEIERKGKTQNSQWLDVSRFEKYDFGIEETDRGNIHLQLAFVRNNRIYHETHTIEVPWSNKELKISYSSFRDKMLPGSEEVWKLTVSGQKKDKIAAELVAAMYDASLDQFIKHQWSFSDLYPISYPERQYSSNSFRSQGGVIYTNGWQYTLENPLTRIYRNLNWFNLPFGYRFGIMQERVMAAAADGAPSPAPPMKMTARAKKDGGGNVKEESEVATKDQAEKPGSQPETPATPTPGGAVRTNLKETVFFLPNLQTDENGNVVIKFTMNEALTRWKFLGLAHTKDLKVGTTEKEVITQKDLMVQPNLPRFIREGDDIGFAAKVVNLSGTRLDGMATIELVDAITGTRVDSLFGIQANYAPFTVDSNQSTLVSWNIKVPYGKINALIVRIIAKSGNFSDGEENPLPVLTNRMLVTETLPLAIRGKQKKTFVLESLKNSNSTTLQHHRLTLEFSQNPAWYAVQALPYLMEYPYECTEQIFNRYYANSLATTVANSNPKIYTVFEKWKNQPEALLSNLNKNQELKAALLEETPWVLQAQNESTMKRNVGLLFDLGKMAQESKTALKKLLDRQLSNGGFAWFPGGKDEWYMTQYIVEGLGHLEKLGVKTMVNDVQARQLFDNAVNYTDARLVEHYQELEQLVQKKLAKFEDDHLDFIVIHYLYSRSLFKDVPMNDQAKKAVDYYLGQAKQYWLGKGLYLEGMLALALHRYQNAKETAAMIRSFRERAVNSEEFGMYWKFDNGYYWYQLPIETQALMIEVFSDIAKDDKAVDDLKVWLLKNKQTNAWKTTKATAAATYSLLMYGSNWLLEDRPLQIKVGSTPLEQNQLEVEAGTGYFKTAWKGAQVDSKMAEISVENPNSVVAWGGVYWQYSEQLDKIKGFKETPLTLTKTLFQKVNTPSGPVIRPVTDATPLQTGDRITVRIVLKVDRPMEYVHLKDMHASILEPVNVISQYKWQDGLGYYESTRDASTNFFIHYLPKGTYVFEYPLVVFQRGNSSNGITSIQCMYAPEFSSHSEGIRIQVK